MAALLPSPSQQQQQQQPQHLIDIHAEVATHLPTALGLKIRTPQKHQQLQQPQHQQHQPQQHQQQLSSHNSNSLLKQQLRAGLKDIDGGGSSSTGSTGHINSNHPSSTINPAGVVGSNLETLPSTRETSCSALQSLANVAERQAPNAIQPPSANNLHHQFLLHMAANPILKSGSDFFQQQQQQQQQMLEDDRATPPSHLELLLEQNADKSEPELTLADESAGLDYKSSENSGANDNVHVQRDRAGVEGGAPHSGSTGGGGGGGDDIGRCGLTSRPIQRRRIRRKAQSSLDDQAEHLTEMSVRGLDLFRYASITEGVYQCTECAKENVQKTFKNKYSFQRHAFLYHEGKHRKVFPCPMCGKEFSRPDKMKNHMKMTHESFGAKEIANFNPLNYLITAAAAGEIPSSFFPQQQQQTQQQQQQQSALLAECMQEELAAAVAGRGGSSVGVDDDMCLNLTPEETAPPSPSPLSSSMQSEAEALLKLQNDIVCIKNEIVISPSPSPPPRVAVAQATPTQRLEEVK